MTDNRTTDRVDHSPRVRDAIDELMHKKDATDNRTTERLMAMLEERGVEYKTHGIIGGKAVTWHGSVCNWIALPDERGLAVAVYKDYLTPEQAIAATLGWIDEPDTIRNELADGGLMADALAPVCVDEKERIAFERGRVHERFAQQIFKEATS